MKLLTKLPYKFAEFPELAIFFLRWKIEVSDRKVFAITKTKKKEDFEFLGENRLKLHFVLTLRGSFELYRDCKQVKSTNVDAKKVNFLSNCEYNRGHFSICLSYIIVCFWQQKTKIVIFKSNCAHNTEHYFELCSNHCNRVLEL